MNNPKRDMAISRMKIVLEQSESFEKKLGDMDDLIACIRRGGVKALEIDVAGYGKTTVNTESLLGILVKQRKELREQRDFFSKNIIMSASLFNSVFTIPLVSDLPSESPDKPDESPDRPDISSDQADQGE